MCVSLRYEISSLGEDLEMEMRYLEAQGIFMDGKSWSWMKKELVKAREEVDRAIEEKDGFKFIEKASLHEAMILAIMKHYLSKTKPMWSMPDE